MGSRQATLINYSPRIPWDIWEELPCSKLETAICVHHHQNKIIVYHAVCPTRGFTCQESHRTCMCSWARASSVGELCFNCVQPSGHEQHWTWTRTNARLWRSKPWLQTLFTNLFFSNQKHYQTNLSNHQTQNKSPGQAQRINMLLVFWPAAGASLTYTTQHTHTRL